MSKEAEAKLMNLLKQIFEDDVVSVSERSSLLEFQAEGALDHAGIERVFARFVDLKWGEAMKDGILTSHEKLALQRILEELDLPERAVPLQLRMALRHA